MLLLWHKLLGHSVSDRLLVSMQLQNRPNLFLGKVM